MMALLKDVYDNLIKTIANWTGIETLRINPINLKIWTYCQINGLNESTNNDR